MEDADDIAGEIMSRLGPPPVEPTAKANAITGAIVAPSTMGDPSTARGIHYSGRPGNDGGDQIFVRMGSAVAGTTAAIFAGTLAGPEPATDGSEFTAADELNKVEMMDDPDSTDPADMVPVEHQFMPVSGSQMSLSKGFSSEMHMRSSTDDGTGATTTDEINLFTNMEAPGSMSWAMYYATADRSGVSGMANTTEPADNTQPRIGQITIQVDETQDNFNGKLLSSPAFPSGDSQDWIYNSDNEATLGVNEETRGGRMMDGSFNGVSGRFTCSGAVDACTVSTDENGDIDELGGAWVFVPGSVRSQIPDVDHDADYLAFGWWLRGVTDSDGDTTYSIGTFADGADLMTFDNIRTNLEGTASYSGPAGGKYARKTLNAEGATIGLRAGHFTADATLTAHFGGDDVAVSNQFSISGKVQNLMDENDHALAGWTVDLMKAGFAASGVNAVAAPDGVTAVAETFYGETTGKGDWAGQFYGPDVVDDPATGDVDESETGYPTGVAGEFTAHFSNGHVIGAFGATKD